MGTKEKTVNIPIKLVAHGRHIAMEGKSGVEWPIASINENLPEDEARHYAQLFAAAPELLEALHNVEDVFATYLEGGQLTVTEDISPVLWSVIEEARAAIAKATN